MMHERRFWALAAIMIVSAAPSVAADRTLSITDFDRLQATGAMTVIVNRSNATRVRVSGDSHDLDTLDISVHGQTLRIGAAHFGWGSRTQAHASLTVYVSTPHLSAVAFTGSGRITIDQLRGPRITAWLSGSGEMNVAQVQAENLTLAVAGSGRLTAAGNAAQAKLESTGSATLEASGLRILDATLAAYGAATINSTVSRSADATATGAASINVAGHPACAIHNTGAGTIVCN